MDLKVSALAHMAGSRAAAVAWATYHRPLVVAAAAFALGTYFGGWPWASPVVFSVAVGLAVTGSHIGRRLGGRSGPATSVGAALLGLSIALAFAACGAFRAYVQSEPGPYDIARWIGAGYVRVTAHIASEPDARHGVAFVARPISVRLPDGSRQPCAGLLSCRVAMGPQHKVPRYGDVVHISGTLQPTTGGASLAFSHMRRHGVFAAIHARYPSQWQSDSTRPRHGLIRMALSWRNSMLDTFRRYLPLRDAALATGIALGGVQGMSEEQADAFRMSGLLHIVAASGANVAILVGPLLWITRRLCLSRTSQALVCALAVVLYAVAAGAQPAVTRAAIMAAVYLSAPLFDRDHDAPTALAAAALASLMWDPGNLQDVGFMLSFIIVAALVAFWPVYARGIGAALPALALRQTPLPMRIIRHALRGISATIVITAIAGMAAAPLTAQVFNAIPTLGIPANALAAPALIVLLPTSLCAWIASLISPGFGQALCSTIIAPLASYIGAVAEAIAATPGSVLHTPSPGWPLVCACYILMAIGALALARQDAK